MLKEKLEKIDKMKLAKKVIASIMVVMMVFSICGTVLFHLFTS